MLRWISSREGALVAHSLKVSNGMAALDSLDSGMWEGKYLQKIASPLTGMDNKEQGM